MSKIVAGAAFVLLGGATVAGGVLLTKSKSSDQTQDQTPEPDIELPTSWTDFKTKGKDKGCLKTLFPSLENMNGTPNDTSTSVDNFFASGKETKGCLIVNWDKNTKPKDNPTQWNGTFRLLWAVKGKGASDADKGFIVFLVGTAPSDGSAKEIKWEGALYTLSDDPSEGTAKKWSAKQRQDVGTNKVFKKGSGTDPAKEEFPQPSTDLKDASASKTIPEFWGWFSGIDDLEKIASITSDGSSDQSAKSSFRAHWEWTGKEGDTTSGKKEMTYWTKDMDKWWNKIFDSSTFALKTVAEKQKGTWLNKKYSEPTSSTVK